MIRIHYLDAYKIERTQEFSSLDEALRAFAGCFTIPDYYPVTSIQLDGQDLHYQGSIGEVYAYLNKLATQSL